MVSQCENSAWGFGCGLMTVFLKACHLLGKLTYTVLHSAAALQLPCRGEAEAALYRKSHFFLVLKQFKSSSELPFHKAVRIFVLIGQGGNEGQVSDKM